LQRYLFRYACPNITLHEIMPPNELVRRINQTQMCRYRYHSLSFSYHYGFNNMHCGSMVIVLREPRRRLLSAFFYTNKRSNNNLMGIKNESLLIKIKDLMSSSLEKAIQVYSMQSEVRNLYTKMLLGIHRYKSVPDNELNSKKAIQSLNLCFPFIGILERFEDSLHLFHATMSGSVLELSDVNVSFRVGGYRKSLPQAKKQDETHLVTDHPALSYLDNFHDNDQAIYQAAHAIFLQRFSAMKVACSHL